MCGLYKTGFPLCTDHPYPQTDLRTFYDYFYATSCKFMYDKISMGAGLDMLIYFVRNEDVILESMLDSYKGGGG